MRKFWSVNWCDKQDITMSEKCVLNASNCWCGELYIIKDWKQNLWHLLAIPSSPRHQCSWLNIESDRVYSVPSRKQYSLQDDSDHGKGDVIMCQMHRWTQTQCVWEVMVQLSHKRPVHIVYTWQCGSPLKWSLWLGTHGNNCVPQI